MTPCAPRSRTTRRRAARHVPRHDPRPLSAVHPRHAGPVSAPARDAALRDGARPRLSAARSCNCVAACARSAPPCTPTVYRRLTTLMGEEAQIDWGAFGSIRIGHGVRPLSGFVMVLSYSRAVWALFTLDQTLESFLRGHVEAFDVVSGRRADPGLRQPPQRRARTRRAPRFGFIRASSSSPATITSPRGPVRPAAAMRRAKSSAKFSTSGMPSLPRGPLPMSTI